MAKIFLQTAKEMIDSSPQEFSQSSDSITYLHCPIPGMVSFIQTNLMMTESPPDRDVIDDGEVTELITKVLAMLRRGERVYVHCYGGHGRTGVVASVILGTSPPHPSCRGSSLTRFVVLGKVYNVDSNKAMELCKLYHDSRPDVDGNDIISFISI